MIYRFTRYLNIVRQYAPVLLLLLFSQQLQAQRVAANTADETEYKKKLQICGVSTDYVQQHAVSARTPVVAGLVPTNNFPPSAIVPCGKFAIYYEDLIPTNPQIGFNDPTWGVTRRNTLCAVLTYLQNTFDFSNVSASDPIRLYIEQSYAAGNPAPGTTTWFAQAGPYFNQSQSGLIYGYVRDYVVTGVNTAPTNGYHATMKVNFDQVYHQLPNNTWVGEPINWYNAATGTLASCQSDLFTTLLHEMGHTLGFISFVQNAATSPSLNMLGQYSATDDQLYVGAPGGGSKLINSGVINGALPAQNNYWLGNQAPPETHPIYSGEAIAFFVSPGTYCGHLDEQQGTYTRRWRLSPGNYQDYVMGPFGIKGAMRRQYSEGDLKVFNQTLGYSFTPAFAASIAPTYNNRAPYSTRMAGYTGYTQEAISTFAECMPADFPVLVNNLGSSITYYFANDPTISDADGDPIYAKPNSIINFRGCGNSQGSNGGNNHDQVTPVLDGAGNIIGFTFMPRADFFGRAQLGLSLWDGKEQGSFVVYTIDVAKGNNVNFIPGNNLVLNGGFEEGTEVKTIGPDENIDNTTVDMSGLRENRFNIGLHMADAHPVDWLTNNWTPYGGGIIIKNANIPCGQQTILKHAAGDVNNAAPGGSYYPNIYVTPTAAYGNRYQGILPYCAAFYPLGDSVRPCHVYKLEFDAYAPLAMYNQIEIGFLPGFNCGINWNNFYNQPYVPINAFSSNVTGNWNTTWTHYELHFKYCGSAPPAGLLYLHIGNNMMLVIDNISLKEEFNAPPLTATITPNIITPCQTVELTGGAQNNACNLTYQWQLNGGPVFSTAQTITVNYGTTVDNYTLTVFDGCDYASTTYKTDINTGVTISSTGTCLPATLTANPNNPNISGTFSWTGPGSFSANTQSINPTQSGTYTVYFTSNGCTASASYTFSSGGACCAADIIALPGTIIVSNNPYPSQPIVVPSSASALIGYFGTNVITTNDYLLFDDNFIVDKDITFSNCPNMVFAATPQSGFVGMTVMPGVRLYLINGSYLRAACKYMWNGIFATDPSSLVYVDGCDIRDMRNGINITNDVNFNLTNTNMADNYYSLYMRNGTAAYNPTIRKNTFTTTNGLQQPYGGQVANTGIYLQNMHYVVVGDPAATGYNNVFNSLKTGVYVYDTLLKKVKDFYQVKIYNALFNSINGGNYNLPGNTDLYKDAPGNAVFGRNASIGVPVVSQILMYNNSQTSGRINKCTKGVTLYNMSADIRNVLIQTPVWGITISKPDACSYTIWNNSVLSAYRGIEIVGTPQSGSINGNTITSVGGTATQTFNGVNIGYPFGIASSYYLNTAANTLTIDNNNITMNNYGGQGIYLYNSGSGVRAYKNTVKLATTSNGSGLNLNDFLYGINASYCLGSTIQENAIKGSTATLTTSRANLAGIYIYTSQKLTLSCNHDSVIKYGWYVTGNCVTSNTLVSNNDFYNHGYGILYRHMGVNGTFSNVGAPLYDANNIFKGSYSTYLKNGVFYNAKMYRLSICSTASTDRFYTSNGTLTMNESIGNLVPCYYGVQGNFGGYTKPKACKSLNPTKVPLTFDNVVDIAYAEQVAQGTAVYADFPSLTEWMEKKRLYEQLSRDPGTRRASTILDNFYMANQTGVFEQIRATDEQLALLQDSTVNSDSVLFDQTLQRAKAAQRSIAATNLQETNEVTINDLFLKYIEYGVESIDNRTDIATIATLATQCPFVGGTAVYKARMMYGIFYPSGNWDDFDNCWIGANKGSSNGFGAENTFLSQVGTEGRSNGLQLYPNPTDGKITISYHLEANEQGTVEITDLFGRSVKQVPLYHDAQSVTTDLGNQPAGVYYYRYQVNDQVRESGKLVLIR